MRTVHPDPLTLTPTTRGKEGAGVDFEGSDNEDCISEGHLKSSCEDTIKSCYCEDQIKASACCDTVCAPIALNQYINKYSRSCTPPIEPSVSMLEHSRILDELIRRANSAWELQGGKEEMTASTWFRTWPERTHDSPIESERRKVNSTGSAQEAPEHTKTAYFSLHSEETLDEEELPSLCFTSLPSPTPSETGLSKSQVNNNRRPSSLTSLFSRAWHSFRGAEASVPSSLSTTHSSQGLILEGRPSNLPAKQPEEEFKHIQEHDRIVDQIRKKEKLDEKQLRKQMACQLKEEERVVCASKLWTNDILPHWETVCNTKKVRDLWWSGLPPCVRGKVWKLAVGNELGVTSQTYHQLVQRVSADLCVEQGSGDGEGNSSSELIRLDVSRTFPQLGIFQKGGPLHIPLVRLLCAWAIWRPHVDYVQGMSFVASVLLLNMEEEEAFVTFANLIHRPLHHALFTLHQPTVRAYYSFFEEVLQSNLPRLHSHLTKLGLTPDLYLPDWLYTIFSRSLPLDLACRVWDVFLRDGDIFLFRVAAGLLRLLQPHLLRLDFIQGAQAITRLPVDVDGDSLFRSTHKIRLKKLPPLYTQ